MRSFLIPSLLLLLGSAARADDGTAAIVDKAIKAHGGAEKLTKDRPTRSKSKGTIEVAGGLHFTQEVTFQGGKFKEVMVLDVAGKEITVTTVFDGTKAWVNANSNVMELDGKLLEEIKEAAHLARLGRMVFLKDKTVTLSPLGEIKVGKQSVVGVKVASKGHRDLDLFFDKETGLLTKTVRQAFDPQTQNEIAEERIVEEYQEVDGAKVAKKVLVNRDGKKFMELEVLEVKHPEKIEDSEFAKP